MPRLSNEIEVRSKRDLYIALRIKGQLFLPPENLCSYAFLRDILAGKKKVFHSCEVVEPNLPKLRSLCLKCLIEMAKKNPTVMQYLPADVETLKERMISHSYISAVINTLDSTFFDEALKKADLLGNLRHAVKDEIVYI